MNNVYKISEHARSRYAERIMGKDDQNAIMRFVLENESKIKTDINKMIEYGEKIFSGKKSQTNGKGKVIDVYLKDTWVILVDEPAGNVVTLYKIDLGCGDEDFNIEYIKRMMNLLQEKKDALSAAKNDVEIESALYKDLIEDNTAQINTYKTYISNLQKLNEANQEIIKNNTVKISMAEEQLADVINKLIGKKEF